jgi:hypothetical protein
MQQQFDKVVINIDGHSSKIENQIEALYNICSCLKLMGLPYEIYKPHKNGFKSLKADMNRPNTLYILNDSLQYHLCEVPCILVCRSIPWVQAAPKKNTIGVITLEMLLTGSSYLMALIHRNTSVRQFYDEYAAKTYLVVNDYISENMDTMHRYSMAMISWNHLSKQDIHFSTSFHTSKTLPFVSEILNESLDLFSHPDDIVIITNRDICLVKESTAIIRAYMDSLNLTSCYARRVDMRGIPVVMAYQDIQEYPLAPGIDLFAFRADDPSIQELISTDLYLGRMGWDSFWADRIKNELPFKICYHQEHNTDWSTEKGELENMHNIKTISQKNVDFGITYNKLGAYYEKNI